MGDGSFGVVFLASDEKSGKKVAIKKLKMAKSVLSRRMPNFTREMEMMSKLSHPNIVQFIEQFESEERVYIVSEFCELGELSKHVDQGQMSV